MSLTFIIFLFSRKDCGEDNSWFAVIKSSFSLM